MARRSRWRAGWSAAAGLLAAAAFTADAGSPSQVEGAGGEVAESGGADVKSAEQAQEARPYPRAGERRAMVRDQIAARGIRDPRVLDAMRTVPRHEFVPEWIADQAYDDGALPIGLDQTISQPYIVALMSELAAIGPDSKVLEVGTGSGYQAAVLAELAGEVYTIEIVAPLAQRAADTLARLGYERVHTRTGDGWEGWPDEAPFDAILVTAAPDHVPPKLLEQLAPDGRLVIPVGRGVQSLEVHHRTEDGIRVESIAPVLFVPMTGGGGDD